VWGLNERFEGSGARGSRVWRSPWVWTGLILAAALGWKAWITTADLVPFNGDEAIVALMARHILHGEGPVFFYGQAYMGSLDAFLVAAGFWLFGEQVWVIRLVQALLYTGTLVTTVWLGSAGFGSHKTGLLAAALLAIPSVNVTLYTTASLGGYGEALLIGNLLLLSAMYARRRPAPGWAWAIWGCLAGFGLWVNALTVVYSLPALLWLSAGLWKRPFKQVGPALLLGAGAGLAGAAPLLIFIVQHGLRQWWLELFGSAIAVEQGGLAVRVGQHLVSLLLLGLPAAWGLRPPWSVDWLGLPLLPFALMFWLAVMGYLARQMLRPGPRRAAFLLVGGVPTSLVAAFLFTNFGADPSGRYFLPLVVPLALAAAVMVTGLTRLGNWRWLLMGLIVCFQAWGNAQAALRYPPGFTTQFDQETIVEHRYDGALMAFLREKGETRGFTHYWIAYPLAFLSQESLVFAPRLPYHPDLRYTARDSRYRPYDDLANAAQKTAYILSARQILLAQTLRDGFARLEVRWQEHQIGDYLVFYGLSRPVRPQELGLGETR